MNKPPYIIQVKHLWADASVIYPFIFTKDKNNKVLMAHEMVHVEQIKRLGWLRFYATYLYYQIRYGSDKNPFEIEAYKKQ